MTLKKSQSSGPEADTLILGLVYWELDPRILWPLPPLLLDQANDTE